MKMPISAWYANVQNKQVFNYIFAKHKSYEISFVRISSIEMRSYKMANKTGRYLSEVIYGNESYFLWL